MSLAQNLEPAPPGARGCLRWNLGLGAALLLLASLGLMPDGWPAAALERPGPWFGLLGCLLPIIVLRGRFLRADPAAWAVVPLFVLNSLGVVSLLSLLAPTVLDPALADLDRRLLFGLEPAWLGGSWLDALAEASALLVGLAFLVLERDPERAPARRARLLRALLLAGVGAWLVHLAAPAVGPAAWEARLLAGPPPVAELGAISPEAGPSVLWTAAPRGALPSLDAMWVVCVLAAALCFRRRVFWALLAPGLALVLAGLLAGRSGPTGLVLSAIMGLGAWALSGPGRRAPGAGLDGAVALLVTPALGLGLAMLWRQELLHPAVAWAVVGGAIALGVRAAVRLERRGPDAALPGASAADPPVWRGGFPAVLALFFCSGLTGLVYEVVFERELALVFGSTARATTTVLAVYMSGLALGAFLGGRLADRVRRPLAFYALAEALVGLTCLAAPWLFALADQAYLGLARGGALGPSGEAAVQVACCALVVLLPALLMGTTLPMLAKHATSELAQIRRNVASLYSANTLGAAFGALLAAYWLVAALGIDGSLRLATLANFAVAGVALWLSGRSERGRAEPRASRPAPGPLRLGGGFGLVLIATAGLVGFISFALEVLWVHLLAVVAGNSIYAFGLMLFAFLAGLALGSMGLARWRVDESLRPARLAATLMALGASVLLLLPLWDRIPPFLGLYAQVGFADTFGQREFVRFAVCLGMMLLPTLLIGMIFPQLVDLSTRSVDSLGRHVGLVSFSNTLGNILGAVTAGLVLIPWLGSWLSSLLLGGLALSLGVLLALWAGPRLRWRLVGAGVLTAAFMGLLLPSGWNLTALNLGTNVYFSYQDRGEPVAVLEELDGGMSSVFRTERDGRAVSTMLTNGKFQGDDHEEMAAQAHFALYPLLHAAGRERALVIGLGTGVTAAVIHAAGFERLEVAELSADLAALARRYFGHVNDRVLDAPGVELFVTDGRNLLRVRETRYDLISMEVSSIWFAGAANLYNREFYELARRRLSPGGVLQQWLQLHHISPTDVASVLVTLRSEFEHVRLYWGGAQGVLVASQEPLALAREEVAALGARPAMLPFLDLLERDDLESFANDCLLEAAGVDAFVAMVAEVLGVPPGALISTDRNRRLEYSTPRGNVRPHGLMELVRLLTRFQARGG
jgi:spermidine synthase